MISINIEIPNDNQNEIAQQFANSQFAKRQKSIKSFQ